MGLSFPVLQRPAQGIYVVIFCPERLETFHVLGYNISGICLFFRIFKETGVHQT